MYLNFLGNYWDSLPCPPALTSSRSSLLSLPPGTGETQPQSRQRLALPSEESVGKGKTFGGKRPEAATKSARGRTGGRASGSPSPPPLPPCAPGGTAVPGWSTPGPLSPSFPLLPSFPPCAGTAPGGPAAVPGCRVPRLGLELGGGGGAGGFATCLQAGKSDRRSPELVITGLEKRQRLPRSLRGTRRLSRSPDGAEPRLSCPPRSRRETLPFPHSFSPTYLHGSDLTLLITHHGAGARGALPTWPDRGVIRAARAAVPARESEEETYMVTLRGGCSPALSHHPPPLALSLTRSLTGSSQRSSLFAHLSSTPAPAHAARGGRDRAERSSPPSSYSGAAVPPHAGPARGSCGAALHRSETEPQTPALRAARGAQPQRQSEQRSVSQSPRRSKCEDFL